MGIWDTIKKAKNYVTGGGAKILVSMDREIFLKKPFKVSVKIDVENSEIEADRIYLALRYTEHVEMDVNTRAASGRSRNRKHRKQNVLYKQDIILDEMILLDSEDQYDYETEMTLPIDAFPAFKGVNAKLTWSIQAYIDKAGNNPESELVFFEPLYTFQ